MHHRASDPRRAAPARGRAARRARSRARSTCSTIWVLVLGHARDRGRTARRRRRGAPARTVPLGDVARVHGVVGRRARRRSRSCSSSCSCAPRAPRRVLNVASLATVVVMAAQGVLGYVQYFKRIPRCSSASTCSARCCVFARVQQLELSLERAGHRRARGRHASTAPGADGAARARQRRCAIRSRRSRAYIARASSPTARGSECTSSSAERAPALLGVEPAPELRRGTSSAQVAQRGRDHRGGCGARARASTVATSSAGVCVDRAGTGTWPRRAPPGAGTRRPRAPRATSSVTASRRCVVADVADACAALRGAAGARRASAREIASLTCVGSSAERRGRLYARARRRSTMSDESRAAASAGTAHPLGRLSAIATRREQM